MKISIKKLDGTDTGREVELSDDIFNIETRDTLVYEDVRAYLAHQRQGTAKTKGRSEVRGGGRKLYRQKGTGNARRGTLRSPLLKGGGTVFGPKPRDYGIRLSKKMKELARKSALTYKAREEAIVVVEDISFDAPKTKQMVSVLSALNLAENKVLLLTAAADINVYKSGRNIPKLNILEANKPSTYEILHAQTLVITESALEVLQSVFNKKHEEAAA